MKWNASFKPVIAFIALMFICHELHELIHTSIAYWQCGCWGERDFNVWTVCKACPSTVNTVWATLAGPLLTYALIWSGWWLMSPHHSIARRSVGFALVWANVPFARLITVLMKGGDEGVIARAIVGTAKAIQFSLVSGVDCHFDVDTSCVHSFLEIVVAKSPPVCLYIIPHHTYAFRVYSNA
jgi:hypothetical protein